MPARLRGDDATQIPEGGKVTVDDRKVKVEYWDCIILDDDSFSNLEAWTACLMPATLYSRLISSKPTAA